MFSLPQQQLKVDMEQRENQRVAMKPSQKNPQRLQST